MGLCRERLSNPRMLLISPCRLLDDIYLTCELDCSLPHVQAVVEYLQVSVEDFTQVCVCVAVLQRWCCDPHHGSYGLRTARTRLACLG